LKNVALKKPAGLTHSLDSMAEALLLPTGIDGVYARTALFEQVVNGLTDLITQYREPETEVLRLPPVMSRRQVEKSGYLKSFPHFLGCVSCLDGSESEIRAAVDRHEGGQDWTPALAPADLVLSPAACYPLYPLVASRGRVPAEGLLFDVAGECFRREPSKMLDRMQSFRMREYVCVGGPAQVEDFRARWLKRAETFAAQLDLSWHIDHASDPFFGRGGKLMATSQVEQALKFELLIPVHSADQPTACMSFNYHRDHFGTTWNIRTVFGEAAHTACVAFGIDRLALALFAAHGVDLPRWPARVRGALTI